MKNNKIIFLFLFWVTVGFSQSTTGTRGLVKAPTARMFESGTIALGTSFIPPGYHKKTFGFEKGQPTGNGGLNTFVTVNFLPFMEVMFRYTHELNVPVTPLTRYFPDRMFTARFILLNESKSLPAIVVGMQDITALFDISCKGCSNFSSLYIVGSKAFKFNQLTIDTSLGYGSSISDLEAKEFRGLFGGVSLQYDKLLHTELLIDYDAEYLNVGIQKLFFNRIQTMFSFYPKYQKVGWMFAYRYQL